MEIWRPIKGYEGLYEVSNYGNVRGVDRYARGKLGSLRFVKGVMRKKQETHKGYFKVMLRNGEKYESKQVHRLVAEAFIPNPRNLPQVNHKDTDKKNNKVENLEWITNYGNIQHAILNGCYKPHNEKQKQAVMKNLHKGQEARKKEVARLNEEGKIMAIYKSITEASRRTRIDTSKISLCCKGKRKHAGGYRWKYIESIASVHENANHVR